MSRAEYQALGISVGDRVGLRRRPGASTVRTPTAASTPHVEPAPDDQEASTDAAGTALTH
jgi:hypothetical protein